MAEKIDSSSLFKIGYGLYAVTTYDGVRDNGCIVNTVCQLTSDLVSVTVNRQNHTCDTIAKTGRLNVNCLTEDTPFSLISSFGFRSGRDADKLKGVDYFRSENGLCVLIEHTNAFISLDVVQSVEFDSHIMFICSISEAKVLSEAESLTYAYYHKNIKPKPQAAAPKEEAGAEKPKRYACKICGYIHEGELPDDFICPLCKHPASDFEEIE